MAVVMKILVVVVVVVLGMIHDQFFPHQDLGIHYEYTKYGNADTRQRQGNAG